MNRWATIIRPLGRTGPANSVDSNPEVGGQRDKSPKSKVGRYKISSKRSSARYIRSVAANAKDAWINMSGADGRESWKGCLEIEARGLAQKVIQPVRPSGRMIIAHRIIGGITPNKSQSEKRTAESGCQIPTFSAVRFSDYIFIFPFRSHR
jgi:hypothetical protein